MEHLPITSGVVLMAQTSNDIPKLRYQYNSLSFEFSAQYHYKSDQNVYSYFLTGFDEKWTDWSPETKAMYTNLPEGKYTFKVKAKNVYGQISNISEYSFVIKAPWYRTVWAYMLYVFVGLLIFWELLLLYTRRLKRIIKLRTAEVVAQKEQIIEQKNEVEEQRKQLEYKNESITASINYARRLQRAILPEENLLQEHLKDYFILYKPKDIVSGDFYWVDHLNGIPGRDISLFAAVDCTGHGVPGAFVSVVGNSSLNRAVKEFGLSKPSEILEKLNELVVETLSKGDEEVQDGMDISLCAIDYNKMILQFAGAHNSAYLVRQALDPEEVGLNGNGNYFSDNLVEIKANKQPVGFFEYREAFQNNEIKLKKGDCIYLFSDGFADQFGGPKGKKYNYYRFKEFLSNIHKFPMNKQKRLLDEEFENWRGEEEQIDDVIVFGVRV